MATLKDYLDEKQLEQATRLINFAKQHKQAYEINGRQIKDLNHPRIIISVYNQDKLPAQWERTVHGGWFFYLKAKAPDKEDFGNTFGAGINYSKEYKNFERFFSALPKLFYLKDENSENKQIAKELLKIAKECIFEKEPDK